MRWILAAWFVLIVVLAPLVLQIQNYFVYSDSPFLSSTYQSVKVSDVVVEYFHDDQSQYSYIYVLSNGSYNGSLAELNYSLKYLQGARILTPYQILNDYNSQYLNEVEPLVGSIQSKLMPLHELYLNLTRLRDALLDNFSLFLFQLNVTYGVPLGLHVNASPRLLEEFKTYYFLALQNYSELNASRVAGYLTFKNPFLVFFSFNNFTNRTLAKSFLENFNEYPLLIYLLTKHNVSQEALVDPHSYAVDVVEKEIPPPPFNLSQFHRNYTWLFIVEVPKNESLNSINRFIENVNAEVTGHLPIYAQSAFYTEQNLRLIDLVTIILVGVLLVVLVRALLPIILLVTGALLGVEISYTLLELLTFSGYQIYYISGLVIPPIVFGITVDYSLLFLYRYFEELRKGSREPLKLAFRTAGRGALFSGLSIAIGFSSFVISPSPLLRNIGIALLVSSLSSLFPVIGFMYTALRSVPPSLLAFPKRDVPNTEDPRSNYLRRSVLLALRRKYLVIFFTVILALVSLYVFATHPTNVNVDEIVPAQSTSVRGLDALSNLFNYSLDYLVIKGNPNSSYNLLLNITNFTIKHGAIVYGPTSLGRVVFDRPTAITNQFYSHNYTLTEVLIPYPVFSHGAIAITEGLMKYPVLVGGSNAERIDIVDSTVFEYYHFVLPLTVLLILFYLTWILGSLVVPIRLVVTLAISSLVGVAFMFAVFGSVYWLSPLIVFALLFSLGIDYDMFIILRIKEEIGTEEERIMKGVEKTGLVVTAAGLILSGAFISLAFTDMKFLREIGVAVAFSILFDTFIVRPILVPAIMSVLKQYNWWPHLRADNS